MRHDELINEYFDWMYQLVCGDFDKRLSFRKLLTKLFDMPFEYTLPMDENREADGIRLRYRFGQEYGYDQRIIASVLDVGQCRILEMMVSLALRCEEQLMTDDHYGNRTGQWFWNMVNSLGLGGMTDEKYDRDYTAQTLDIFNRRAYRPNGDGGLFRVENSTTDMRKLDIWYQLQAYINDFMKI